MVNGKGKLTVCSSNLNPNSNDSANTSQTKTTVCSPMSINVKETATASENEVNEGNASKEVRNEENAILDTEKERNGIEEEKNEETAMEEEKYEDSAMEPNEIEEEDNEQNVTEQEEEVDEEEAEEKEEEDQDEEEKEENEKNMTEQGKNKEKVGVNSGEKDTRSRKRRRKKKVALRGSETVATKAENNPGSSSKKKESKRAESTGMIFMCSSKTKEDCYRYKVLGLPASKRDIVQKVYKGMRLFLFDFDLRLMYGIYKAAQPGGYNIEPKAFKSAFPSQVRFTVLEDCLPLAEEKFKTVIKDNYYKRNKFNCELTSEQVKNLCKLFTASSRGFKSKELGRNRRAENRKYLDRDRIRRRSLDEERHSVLVADSRYHDRPIMYEREMFASTVAPLPRLPPLPPPRAPAPLNYASYGRTLDMDVYRRDPLVERSNLRLLDLEARLLDETGSHDPYISYRAYRDPLYSTGRPPEYNPPAGLRPEYRHPPGAPLDYRHTAEAPSEYGPLRPLYRY